MEDDMNRRYIVLTLALTCTMLVTPACKKEEEAPYAGKRLEVTMEVKEKDALKGSMVFELMPEKSPKAVEQFADLVNQGYYNNLLFFHVSQSGIVQSGCPFNDGSGHADKAVKANIDSEYIPARGDLVLNTHFEGDPTAVSSQFIIFKQPVAELNGKYPLIGKLVAGAEVLDSIHIGDTLLTVTLKATKKKAEGQ
jgi:peptidyl-prolyl cis-trans isomerase B (cyclophilin B)